jgi:hypothetical protein
MKKERAFVRRRTARKRGVLQGQHRLLQLARELQVLL